jgi:hypothetical protein
VLLEMIALRAFADVACDCILRRAAGKLVFFLCQWPDLR